MEEEKVEMKDAVNEEAKVNKQNEPKSAKQRINASKKLQLAIYCRDFELENERAPKGKELRREFPWLKNRQMLHRIKDKKQ